MRRKQKLAIIAAVCFIISKSLGAQDTKLAGGAVTIKQARQMLETYSNGKKLGNVDLTAVNYFREVELGRGIRALVVSTKYGGGIVIFSPKGEMESSLATGVIESIGLFDLNDDGVSEILADESEGPATGVVIMHYDLYAMSNGEIKRVWHALSYKMEAPWQPDQANIKVNEVQDFVRFNQANAGFPSRMTYLISTGDPGRFQEVEYVMTGLNVHEISGASVKKRTP